MFRGSNMGASPCRYALRSAAPNMAMPRLCDSEAPGTEVRMGQASKLTSDGHWIEGKNDG